MLQIHELLETTKYCGFWSDMASAHPDRLPADISHQAAKAAIQVFHNPCKATQARFSSAILASYRTRVIQPRQVQRHTQAGVIVYGFWFCFLPI